ncbi:MAG: ABC transporter ATP-binding protein [Spirochaetia bacterium]|jgi:branched-chain amino acid transport system ATP-binding protein
MSGAPRDATGALLEVSDLHHWFGGLHVINGVSFSCRAGIVKAIIGPNGAGKTTLFNLVAGNLSPVSGSILFDGVSTRGLPPHKVADRGISRTFQATRLFPRMTVLENVMVGMHARARHGFLAGLAGPAVTRREEARVRLACMAVLDTLGVADLADRDAQDLPFGRQRVVELARALAAEPKLLLLDEPACGLNPRETEGMAALIASIRDRGITILVVEHDMSLVMGISDEVLVLSYGQRIAEGTPREIQSNPEVVSVYLGADDA